jgi:hypothetical protein
LIGECDLTWTDKNGNTQNGTNIISKILNGCVIEEIFSGGNYLDKSVSVYNTNKKSGNKPGWITPAVILNLPVVLKMEK